MTSSLAFANKNVLIARAKGKGEAFAKSVEQYGGTPIVIPLISFKPVEESEELLQEIEQLSSYDWIIFTSEQAVESFLSFLNGSDYSMMPKMAVIGKKTAEVLKRKGLHPSFMPSKYVSEVFVEEFKPFLEHSSKVLLPKGNLARDYICYELTNHGVLVKELIMYETYLPEESKQLLARMIREHTLQIIPFTSPSTVEHFMTIVKEYSLEQHLRFCVFAVIGPVTEKKALSAGLPIHASPAIYTIDEMLKSIVQYIEKNHDRKCYQ